MRAKRGKPRRRRSEAGFTMIEVLIASLLSAIAMSGIVGLYMVQMRSSGFSRHQTEATILAEDKLEALRTQLAPSSGADPSSGLLPALCEPGIQQTGVSTCAGGIVPMFDRRWNATPTASAISLSVTVSWTEEGIPRQLTVSSSRGP